MIINNIEYTSVDELIKELQNLSNKGYGNDPVSVNGVTSLDIGFQEYYYDGGYLLREMKHDECSSDVTRNYLRSKNICKEDSSLPKIAITISDTYVNEFDTIDGRKVREIRPRTWEFLDLEEQEERNMFDGQLVKYFFENKKDEKLGCHPCHAYLADGQEAIGISMNKAKENLKKIYKKL